MRTRLWRLDALDRRILVIAVPALGSLLVEPVYVLTVSLLLSPVLPLLFTNDADAARAATIALVLLAAMQLPAALTFVLDGVLMGANDFRDLRWQTTIAFALVLPVFVAVMVRPLLGITTVWLGMLLWVCVRAVKNHLRVHGDRWLTSAESV